VTIDLRDALLSFADFLRRNWEHLGMKGNAWSPGSVDGLWYDWAQANWELLLESVLQERIGKRDVYLEPYGNGADCNDRSSRVWKPEAIPTHRLLCRPRDGQTLGDLLTRQSVDTSCKDVVFDQFASKTVDGWYRVGPPFDCVLGHLGEQEVLVPCAEVCFVVAVATA
jgi:hypothetical protein